jgi:hypothetical protein
MLADDVKEYKKALEEKTSLEEQRATEKQQVHPMTKWRRVLDILLSFDLYLTLSFISCSSSWDSVPRCFTCHSFFLLLSFSFSFSFFLSFMLFYFCVFLFFSLHWCQYDELKAEFEKQKTEAETKRQDMVKQIRLRDKHLKDRDEKIKNLEETQAKQAEVVKALELSVETRDGQRKGEEEKVVALEKKITELETSLAAANEVQPAILVFFYSFLPPLKMNRSKITLVYRSQGLMCTLLLLFAFSFLFFLSSNFLRQKTKRISELMTKAREKVR